LQGSMVLYGLSHSPGRRELLLLLRATSFSNALRVFVRPWRMASCGWGGGRMVLWEEHRPFARSMAASTTAVVLTTTHIYDNSKKDNGVVMASLALSCWLDGGGADNGARRQRQRGGVSRRRRGHSLACSTATATSTMTRDDKKDVSREDDGVLAELPTASRLIDEESDDGSGAGDDVRQ